MKLTHNFLAQITSISYLPSTIDVWQLSQFNLPQRNWRYMRHFISGYLQERGDIPALPFSKLMKTLGKPLGNKIIMNPATIGEKIKNRRLELGLLQIDIARIIGVCEDSITFWENNRSKPQIMHYPKIIEFLGYVPFEVDTTTLGGQIKLYRYLHGLSQEALATNLNIDQSTIYYYENNQHKPSPKTFAKFKSML